MVRKLFIPVFVLLFIPVGLFAQEKWTLTDCINYALEHNIQIKQQKLNTEINENALKRSKLDAFPSLNAGASHNFSFGRALDETTYEFTENQEVQSSNFSVSSSFTLFKGFQRWNRIKQNKFILLSSLNELERIKNDISLNIASSYLQILFSKELVEVSKNQLEVTKQEIERTEKLVEAGSLPKGSLLEIKSQAANEELNLVEAKNQLESSYLNLIQLLELDSIGDFSIVQPGFKDINKKILLPIDSIYAKARGLLPRIKSAKYNLKSKKEALDVAKGQLSPSLSMNVSYGSRYSNIRERISSVDTTAMIYGYTQSGENVYVPQMIPNYEKYPFFSQIQDNASTNIGFTLSIPIFNGMQANYSVNNAKVNMLNARYNLQYEKNQLYKDIQKALSDARSAWKKYQASEKTVQSMQESFKYTKQKFKVGLVNSIEYNTAKNQLTKAESDLLQSKYEYIFKTKILEFYQGIPLEL
jgi:outer membrane protein